MLIMLNEEGRPSFIKIKLMVLLLYAVWNTVSANHWPVVRFPGFPPGNPSPNHLILYTLIAMYVDIIIPKYYDHTTGGTFRPFRNVLTLGHFWQMVDQLNLGNPPLLMLLLQRHAYYAKWGRYAKFQHSTTGGSPKRHCQSLTPIYGLVNT